MKTHSLSAFAVVVVLCAAPPASRADDKKKKQAAIEQANQQWKLQQMQQQQAAAAAAAKKRAAAARAGGQPVPAPGAAGGAQVQVQIANRTGVPIEAFLVQPDGSSQSFGVVQPGPDLTPLQTVSGLVWVFTSNGQEVGRFQASADPVQQWSIGTLGNVPQNAVADVTVQITNHTGQILTHTTRKLDGTEKTRTIGPTGKYTTQPGNQWVFTTPNGEVVQRYTVTSQKQQQLVIGTQQAAIAPPVTSASQPAAPEENNGAQTPEQDILCAYVNQERDRLRLRRVKWSPQLGSSAQQIATDLAASGAKNAKGQPPGVHFNRWALSQGPADFVRYWTQNKDVTEAPGPMQLPDDTWTQVDQDDINRVQQSYQQMVAPQTRSVGFGAATSLAADAKGRAKVFVILFQ